MIPPMVRMPLTPFYRGGFRQWLSGAAVFPVFPILGRQVLAAQDVKNLSALSKLPKSSSWVWDLNLSFPRAPASKPPLPSHT